MSQTNWNDFTPVDDKGAPIKPVTVESGTNWDDFTPAPEPAGLLRKAGDLGLSVAKGVVSVPEAAVGIADIPTGGRVGKFLENEGGAFGFRPKQAKEYLSSLQSDDLQSKQKQFQQADGVLDKAGVALSNPSLVANAVAESVPLMGAGAVPARALLAAAPRVGAAAAGAIGEGVVGAGSAAEAIRQETPDGLLTPTQSGLAAATGATTSAFGFAGGKVAQRLGIGDVDTMFAQGAARAAGAPSAKSIPRQVVEGAIAEGWLEELPQSVSEQVLQNLALNKPWHEGVSDAAVMGTLAGMAMGGGAAGVAGFSQPTPEQTPPPNQPAPVPPPVTGPTLALPAPDRGVIQVAGDGTARTPAYQAPGYVGGVTDVEAKTPRAQATDFASILDTDNVYSGWSNVQDGSDRATMRDQMDYVGRTYGGKTTPENAAQVASDLAQQFKWFRAASPEQQQAAIRTLMEPAAPVNPVREQVAAAAEQGGALSSAALTAIDTGLSNAMQPAPEQAPPQISLEEADARDRAAYEQFFAGFDADPVVSRYFENDDDIPDFDAASNASEEDFLRALGATDEDIQDAIATTRQPSSPQGSAAGNAGAQANEPAGPREGAGEGAASQTGQVNAGAIQQAAPDAPVPGVGGPVGADGAGSAAAAVSGASGPGGAGTGAATGSGAGATEVGSSRAGGRGDSNQALNAPTNLRDALVRVRQQKQEAANAQVAQAPAPAAAPVPGPAAATTVEASGVATPESPFPTTGVISESQASQAQQASPQPTQAAAAPAAAAGLTDGAPTANTGAQAAPAPGPQGAAPAEPEFTTIKTVYGDSVTVRTADLNGNKQRLRQYTKDGKSKAVPAIHRDNLDLTSDKRKASAKEDADNPFFNVITTKDGSTFASQAAASRELNRLAMGETHEVVAASEVQDGAQGFVIRRKPVDAMAGRAETGGQQPAAPAAAELTLDEQLKQVNDQLANQGQVKNANTRAKRDQVRTAIAERDFPAILKAVDGDIDSAEAINQALQYAGDEPKAKTIERVLKNRGITDEYRQRWAGRLMDGQVDELDAEMQSYENKADVERRPNLKNGPSSANTPVVPPAPISTAVPSAQARWDVFMPTERREMLRAAGYADADQARALSGLKWVELSEAVRKAVDSAYKQQVSAAAPAPSPGVVNVPPAIAEALDADTPAAAAAAAPAPKKKPNADKTRAKADLMAALADLGDILGKNTRMNIMPEQEQKLLPVLTRLLDAAFRLGYHKFKDSAKFALDQIRANLGDDAADALTLDHLQGAYIAMAGGKQNADTKRAVIDVETKADIEAHEAVSVDDEETADTAERTLTQALRDELAANRMPKDNPALKKLVEAFDGKPADQARMKQAQEALEAAIVQEARARVEKLDKEGPKTTFTSLLRLYESQPLLNVRTSTSIANQAYSTPAPLAYLASKLAGITPQTLVHEPTGGTGMLLIGTDPKNAVVNELNDLRVSLLKEQGFKPTQKDAAIGPMRDSRGQVDAVITNPPFGSVKGEDGKPVKVKVDGYNIGQIDHLIAAHALATMKDDGRAVLILGANKAPGGLSTDDRIFFNWLYSHYNVAGHFEVEGDLYARQGAGWPVRVIVINGREQSAKLSPVAGTIQRADNWDQVYEQFNKILDSSRRPVRMAGNAAGRASDSQARQAGVPNAAGAEAAGTGGPVARAGADGAGNVPGAGAGTVADRTGATTDPVGHIPDEQRLNGQSFVPPGLVEARPGADTPTNRPAKSSGTTAVAAAPAAAGNEFQTPYIPRSARKDEGVLIPSNMAQPTQDALNRLEDAVGDIDEFARKELGYESTEALHNALMGLQVDSVATAIYQIQQGKAAVIADQTGIGKGRQAASIIRWAARNGMTPVFVSVKPSLFTDMYGDLADIGTHDVAPFILNSTEWVSGADGEKLFANKPSTHRAAIQSIVDNAALPQGRNALFMTYSQINTANLQRQALMALAPNAVFVLDESHNAAGDSGTGDFMISVLKEARGVTYLSATYAKRPDNMPLYFKTDIGDAAADSEGLADAMAAGGLPLQTVVSNNLVKAGQMFRRERSYDGVSIASTFDTANRQLHDRLSDEATEALRAIVSADKLFHSVFVKTMDKALKAEGSKVQDNAGNQVSAGVQHTEFSSVVHNFVRQMLLGLKAQTAADEAIASLKRGEKPIIAVENTMGSFLSEYAAQNNINQGDSLGAFDYRTVLSRALERSRVINVVLPTGDKSKQNIPLSQLDPITRKAYDHAQEVIDRLAIDIPVSPIDWMRAEIARAGFSVAEITGRDLAVDYSNPRKPVLSAIDLTEQRDKVASTRRFNGGELDALILNVAGSTGISLHASEKFADQRQRHMIVAQAAGDINIFMQMLGRVHRTGQVRLPKYTILSVDLPTEKRPTAVLSRKMKSLNANTSSNTESATSVKTADILNKYGDQIVNQYLADNIELARQLGVDDLISADGERVTDDIARKATGRLALQPIEVQRAFYEDVEAQYDALIEYLNKTNQNDLEPRTFDFDAKEVRTEILFDGPNKATPFGEDAVYGEYSIKAQGMAMKPEEIQAAIAESLQGKTGEDHARDLLNGLLQTYVEQTNAALAKKVGQGAAFDLDEYAAFLKPLFGEDGAARMMAQAQAFMANGTQVGQLTVRDLSGAQGVGAGMEFLRNHAIGKTFRVEINSEPYNGVITNVRNTHKTTGNPFSLSKFQITLAVNGALRSITVPATQFKKIEVSSIAPAFRIETLFKEQPANQRETAKIVTGNLLAAYGEIKGARGTIISFTKADGVIEQGILLPKLFDFSKNTQGDYRLRSGADALKFLQQSTNKDIGRFGISTRDGQVRVLPRGDGVQVRVPKSKAQGARYFLDKNLIAVAGDFVSSANAMVANVDDAASAVKVLDLLMDKQALYALPSMAEEAKSMAAKTATSDGAAFSRGQGLSAEEAVAMFNAANQVSPDARNAQRRISDARLVATQQLIDGIKEKWARAPEIIVARNMEDRQVPQEARDYDNKLRSQGSDGEARGFIYEGKVYLLSDELSGPAQIAEVLFHEVLGHYGLRGAFGDGLKPILQQIGTMRRRDVLAKAREYGMVAKGLSDADTLAAMSERDRLSAAEEVLAEMAQRTPEIGFVQRAIAAIRTWLRSNVPGFKNLALTDDEIVRSYIIPARGFVNRSSETPQQALVRAQMAFSRGGSADQTQTEAFKRWYGDWQNTSDVPKQMEPNRDGAQASRNGGAAPIDGIQRQAGVDQDAARADGARRFTFSGASGPTGADGAPVRLYHGTKDDIAAFDLAHPRRKDKGWLGNGVYLTSNLEDANQYARAKRGDAGPNLMPLYANVRNPYEATMAEKARLKGASPQEITAFTDGLKAKGHDGVVLWDDSGHMELVAFNAADVKSAIGNNGNFEPEDDRINFSRAGMADLASKARDELNRTFTAPGKLSWWHKTVGTMYNLAERSPAFKRVFEAAQGFVDDVSYYATDAAEQAPRLLPKLETWRDIAKRPITAADNAAVAKPVFEGTLVWTRDEAGKPVRVDDLVAAAEKLTAEEKARRLLRQDKISAGMLRAWQGLPLDQYEKLIASRYESQVLQAGIVWTPAELKSMFKLTDDQVALYKEFRAATDRSLDTMARSDMLRYGGKDVADLRDMVMDAADAQDAAQILRDHLQMLAKENPERAGELGQLSSGMLDRAAKVQELQEQGYAPLSRFGKYTVDVVDANGERKYFGLFETQREANIMAMKMRKGFGQDAVSQGTLSNEEFKLLAGITPESLELFGNMLGLDSTGDDAQDQAFQEYLRRTKTNRSAMRRLIHRQGIAGYSEDVGRVLASFIYSNARQTSAGLHMGELGEAVTAIPKQQGELKDAAVQLSEYVKNPQEEAQAIRGLLFALYLGGSIASAVVNMSQPAAVTFPWLSQFGGAKQAAAELGRAAKNLANKAHRYEADLAAALKQAEEEGTVSPQEVHQLMAQARGSGSLRPGDGTRTGDALASAGNALTRLSLAWGKVFGAAEQVNRRMTYIAAFRIAKAQKMDNPAAFAKKAVIETQFTYSKANKMKWGRGAVGATVMTFKTYSVAYLELLGRMWSQGGPEGKKAVLLALGMLMLMGGAGGLPFAEDAEDLVDGLAQLAGYNFNSKKAKQELLESVFGQAGAGFVERGITGLPGMPLDVSGRLGMGNLLPGTGIFKEKTDYTRDVLEVVGPVGDLAKRAASGARSILAGDVGAGLLQIAPAAVRNAAKGADMAATGMYRDDKGYKVLDTSPAEAAMKAIGFQPASVAKVQEANFINQQAKNFYNMKAQEIRAKWARGIFEKDQGIVAEARADLEEWNRKNPEQRIVVSMPAVLKRVREMSKTKDQRIADTAPRAMRQQMREETEKARATL